MTPREAGFLLLCSHLGNPARPVLTGPQLKTLTVRVRDASRPDDPDQTITPEMLTALGFRTDQAQRIVGLLQEQVLMEEYVRLAKQYGCYPVTLLTPGYPARVKNCLRERSPGCFWAMGDKEILKKPAIAIVGSRDPEPGAAEFALAAGAAAARAGYAVVSGNARGVDTLAQDACLANGGQVISIVADRLLDKEPRENVLYLSELDYDEPFSAARALSRNRIIHCMGQKTLVSQCRVGIGGTWRGTVDNLKHCFSPVFCFDDGSEGSRELENRGARLVQLWDLDRLELLEPNQQKLF